MGSTILNIELYLLISLCDLEHYMSQNSRQQQYNSSPEDRVHLECIAVETDFLIRGTQLFSRSEVLANRVD